MRMIILGGVVIGLGIELVLFCNGLFYELVLEMDIFIGVGEFFIVLFG